MFHEASVSSTQDAVLKRLQAGIPAPFAVLADTQSQGRGRLQRTWQSIPGNLMLSVALPAIVPHNPRLPWLSYCTAIAVLRALLAVAPVLAPVLRLKWPNDVMLENAKLAGILIETVPLHGQYVPVVGIGLNILHVPDTMPYQTTALAAHAVHVDRMVIADNILHHLQKWHAHWQKMPIEQIAAAWEAYANTGDLLHVRTAQHSISGHYAGLDDSGMLLLRTPQGVRRIMAGDMIASKPDQKVN